PRRIVNTGLLDTEVLTELFGSCLSQILHVIFRAKMQAARGARLDTGRFQALAHPIRTQRAFEHLLCGRIKFRDVEWATADAISTTNAVRLLKIDDAVGVL